MARYMYVDEGVPVGSPQAKPGKITLPSGHRVACAHWPDAELAQYGWYPVNGEADPAVETETAYAFDEPNQRVNVTLTAKPVADARTDAIREVDRQAEAERLKYITPGDGQAMVYRGKLAEAESCIALIAASGTPQAADYSFLQAEVDAGQAVDLEAAALLIKGTADSWIAIAAAIEAVRRKASKDIDDAVDAAAVQTVLTGVAWPVI